MGSAPIFNQLFVLLHKVISPAANLGGPGGVFHLQGCGLKVFFFYGPDYVGEKKVSAHADGECARRAPAGSQAQAFMAYELFDARGQ